MTEPDPLLPADLLERVAARAAGYDRDNAFPAEDLADLAATGYLVALVPQALGGGGRSIEEVAALQTLLAKSAPATALAVNMHLVWTAVARLLHDRGDASLDFVLAEAAVGEIFAFGVSEPGNDLVLFGSGVEARPTEDGGIAYTGVKTPVSLSPAWTRLGTFGLDDTDPDDPRLVWGFVDRRSDGVEIERTWDTLGQRATASDTVRLTGAVVPADRIVRRLPPGPNADPLVFGIFTAFEVLIAAVYAGISARAVELAVHAATSRTSTKLKGQARSADPDVRHRVAHAALLDAGLHPQVASLARDLDLRTDHGSRWFALASGLKVRVTETAKAVVDEAMLVAGGGGYSSTSELSRLYRDVLAGAFNPSSADSAHSTIAQSLLGPLPS